jgi:glucose-1-phosphate cytidylyltransferase
VNKATEVVILAGGLGTRLQEITEIKPKPMVTIGSYPILLHIISIYLNQGYRKFIVCGGYKVESIREYFSNFQALNFDLHFKYNDDSVTNTYSASGMHERLREVLFTKSWEVQVVDTGLAATTAGRLFAIRNKLEGNNFFCTYGDGVANVDLQKLEEFHSEKKSIATVTAVHPPSRFGELSISDNGIVREFAEKPLGNSRINGGFFEFSKEIFEFLDPAKSLEEGLLTNLASMGKLHAFVHDGYWQNMDTVREMHILNDLWNSNQAPWI